MINDWRKYKQLEVEQRQEQKNEMERLIKKLSMTCRSDLDLERDKEKQKELEDKIKGKVSGWFPLPPSAHVCYMRRLKGTVILPCDWSSQLVYVHCIECIK